MEEGLNDLHKKLWEDGENEEVNGIVLYNTHYYEIITHNNDPFSFFQGSLSSFTLIYCFKVLR